MFQHSRNKRVAFKVATHLFEIELLFATTTIGTETGHGRQREFLLGIGNTKIAETFKNFIAGLGFHVREESNFDLTPICEACASMSQDKVGALILLTQENNLNEIVDTGVKIDALISKPLLENIFFKNAPLHDGGVVISGSRVVAAKCVLPSTQQAVPKSYGMRHRAALGMSEVSDAIVIAVSEETGGISIAHNSVIKRNIEPQRLAQSIRQMMSLNKQKSEENATKEAIQEAHNA